MLLWNIADVVLLSLVEMENMEVASGDGRCGGCVLGGDSKSSEDGRHNSEYGEEMAEMVVVIGDGRCGGCDGGDAVVMILSCYCRGGDSDYSGDGR